MNASRVLRTARCIHSPRTRLPNRSHFQRRFQSSGPSTTNNTSSSSTASSPALVGSLAGGITAFTCCYAWYRFSGAQTAMRTANETKKYVDTAKRKVQETVPQDPSEALKWLRQTAGSYAAFVPGASGAVDSAFDELDKIHESHGKEVDAIVSECYDELKQVGRKGMSAETVKEGAEVLSKHLRRIYELAGSTVEEMLDRHPELRDKLGEPAKQLKQMGERLGPEANKIVDDAWKQASEIVTSGGSVVSAENVSKIQKLIQDATERVRKLGDEAWDKAMQDAKPYLDKNPKVKELLEQNTKALKQGDMKQLVQQVKNATDSGQTTGLEDYIRKSVDKVQSGGLGGLQEYMKKIPNGDQIVPNLSKLQEVAQKHGKEAEELFMSTLSELSQVLSKKIEEAKNLEKRAERDAK
jgi:vacuolar-type H+-ATPase subunit H